MSQVKRLYVEKKPSYAVKAKELAEELKAYLSIDDVSNVRVLIRYDVENVSAETMEKAAVTVFSEPPVDDLYEEDFPKKEGDRVFSVEYLPGQFDQRADSAMQCLQLLNEKEEPIIRSATTYVFSGNISDEEFEKIKEYCINPVDSRETDEKKPETLVMDYEEPADVAIFDGFKDMPEEELKALYDSLGLAMTFEDFRYIQNYYHGEEDRNPSMTEIRVLDTYWSDHCRHTTFSTELKDVTFGDGYYKPLFEKTYNEYLADRAEVYGDRKDKFICLMDLALMGMKKLKQDGLLDNMEETDELIISVDDASDGSEAILEDWVQNDQRIRIIKGPGKGVVKNFENAFKHCRGEIIFLSDQDDVWKKNKMREIERVFEDPKVMAVVHDAQIVDEKLSSLDQTTFEWRNSGTGFWKNMKKNSYIGCCMAVRRSAMKRILPIPDDIWIHDQWIGLLSEQLGEVVFLEEPLIYYRRHGGNVTELTHGSITSMIKKRYHMIMGINHRVKEWSRHDKQNQRHTENS